MSRFFRIAVISLCGSVMVVALGVARSPTLSFGDIEHMFASVFFIDSVTADELKQKYNHSSQGGPKIRILVVPGHDNETWGTEFNGVREADMTALLGEELARLLALDPHYEPILTRSRSGYRETFQDYFVNNLVAVRDFISEKKATMSSLMRQGRVEREEGGVIHNNAPNTVAYRLYGFNKWANENAVDITLHIHFNDYPGRRYNRAGRYDGFAIYIPDPQFSNARASHAVANSLFQQFSKFYAESNLPIEDSGVVEDQDLIAIGSYNTLDPVGILFEYGYIYEQRFLNNAVREATLKELAFQTYQGLNRFFGTYADLFQQYPTTLLPHEWRERLEEGMTDASNVLSLQVALQLENVYPPEGKSKRDCPLTGSFGPCTARAVKLFQQKNGIPQSGVVADATLQKLNEKYGR